MLDSRFALLALALCACTSADSMNAPDAGRAAEDAGPDATRTSDASASDASANDASASDASANDADNEVDAALFADASGTDAAMTADASGADAALFADASDDASEPPGIDHTFIVSRVALPTNASQATMLGFDLDDRPADGMGGIDNVLGSLLASISAVAGEAFSSAAVDASFSRGEILQLVNVHAAGLMSAARTSITFYTGASSPGPVPAPCESESDAVCGRHLDGTGSFTVDPAGEVGALSGEIVDGVLTAGPGDLSLRLTFGGAPFDLPLHRVRVRLEDLSSDGWREGSKIGGAISNDDVVGVLIPAMAQMVIERFDASCRTMSEGGEPGGGCDCDSDGATLQSLFDDSPEDCVISVEEVSSFIDPLITRDIDLDGDRSNDAVSIGVGLRGVRATFDVPTE